MAKTEEDAAQNLEQLKDRVIGIIDKELALQKEKWTSKFDVMADAYDAAMAKVNSTIQSVKSDQRAGEELVLAAVSLVAGKAVGWLAPKAKDRLMSAYPTQWKDMFIDGEYTAYASKPPGEVRAAYFGKIIQPGMDKVSSAAIRKLFPAAGDVSADPPKKGGYISFRTELKETFSEEMKRAQSDIAKLAHAGLRSGFGMELIKELKAMPAYKTARVRPTPEVLEEAGSIRILNDFDNLRKDWAEKWFYYGNDPTDNVIRWTNLPDRMEVSLWAMWVIGQDFKVVPMQATAAPRMGFGMPMSYGSQIKTVQGRDKVRPAHVIMKRLVSGLGETALIDLEYNSHSSLGAAGLGVGKYLEAGGGAIEPKDLPKLQQWAKSRPNPDKVGRSLFTKRSIGTLRDEKSIFK